MIISFQNKHLREICEHEEHAKKAFGDDVAKKLHNRLADLMAADNVLDLIIGSPREISFNGSICYKVELTEKGSLLFESSHLKTPFKGNKLDWSNVSRIKIIDISLND